MNKLTIKEEEIMSFFWNNGPLFVREIVDLYPEPKPHFNTISTNVRSLEEKGFLSHTSYGNTFQYFHLIEEQDYKRGTLLNVVNKYFKNSYLGLVSSFIEEDKISIDELKKLIEKAENSKTD
ncbi:MAG: BlaI/MecI/CopY family transcriptional regulator [Bacteroidales bacterium]|jgi:predicted transcriptional regulator|nr:BlaI/MecI/CopY family transcriptional regulator [Bacteroidales bacterium]